MAKITTNPTVAVTVTFTVSEAEARALDAMAGYGADEFMAHFYKMGSHYMKPHDRAMREFLASIRAIIPPILARADKARAAFTAEKKDAT